MATYTIRPIAEQELDQYAQHIAEDNLSAGLRLYDAAEETYHNLADFPNMGEKYISSNPLLANVHYFPIKGFKNYFVFYQPSDNGIEIIRIINRSRNIKNILK